MQKWSIMSIEQVFEQYEVKTGWKEKAQWRRENRRWLRYSGFIAISVMNRLDELGLTQKELAERMVCSPQYVSKLLRGSENLTLDTISKLEECLGIDLIRSALSPSEGYMAQQNHTHVVTELDPR